MVIDAVVQQADGWLQSIVARHRDDKTSQSATLVHDGAILVATMHDYKNTSLGTYQRVIAVAEVNPDRDALPDLPQRRRAAYDDMQTFETHQELLHAEGRALVSLTNPAASSRIVAHARGLPELINDGRAFERVTRHLYDSKNEQMRRYQRGQTTDFHRALHANAPHPAPRSSDRSTQQCRLPSPGGQSATQQRHRLRSTGSAYRSGMVLVCLCR